MSASARESELLAGAPRALVAVVLEFPLVVPVTWCLVIVMLTATRFWSYWQTFP